MAEKEYEFGQAQRRTVRRGPGGGRMGAGEKPKDLVGTWKKLIRYCKKYLPFIVIAIVCAVGGTIEISELSEKFEERINELFLMKFTWSMKELELFLKDLEMGNLHDRILRLTRPVQEENIFDKNKKNSMLYIKKNPFFNRKI